MLAMCVSKTDEKLTILPIHEWGWKKYKTLQYIFAWMRWSQ